MNKKEKLLGFIQSLPHIKELLLHDSFYDQFLGRRKQDLNLDQGDFLGLSFKSLTLANDGQYHGIFWHKKANFTQATFLELKPDDRFYSKTRDEGNGGHFLFYSFFKLMGKESYSRLISLEYREWESFLRESNRVSISQYVHESHLASELGTAEEIDKILQEIFFETKMSVLWQIVYRALQFRQFFFSNIEEDFQNPASLDYEQQNLLLGRIIKEVEHIFGQGKYKIVAVEAKDGVGYVHFAGNPSNHEEKVIKALLGANLEENLHHQHLFKMKLVAAP